MNLTVLLVQVIVGVIVVAPVLWLAGRALVGKQKSKFGHAVWIVVLVATRYASIASIVAVGTMPLTSWLLGYPWPVTVFAALAAAGVIVLHRANLRRLLRGEENRSTLWRRWWRKDAPDAPGTSPAASP